MHPDIIVKKIGFENVFLQYFFLLEREREREREREQ